MTRCALLLVACLAVPVGARDTSLQARVDAGVLRGVEFLKKGFDKRKGWGGASGTGVYGNVGTAYPYAAGPTALCCYALLKAGVPANDRTIQSAFTFLRTKHRTPGVAYELSIMLVAVAERAGAKSSPDYRTPRLRENRSTHRYRPPKGSPIAKREWTWMVDLTQKLLHFQSKSGGWRYYPKDFHSGGRADVSSTQFALLALSTASRCGYDVPMDVFRRARGFLLSQQASDGPRVPRAIHVPGTADGTLDRARGFPYIGGSKVSSYQRVSGGMTAAGVASLLFLKGELKHLGEDQELDQAILDGFAWIGRYFTVHVNPGYFPFSLGSYRHLWLYAVERAGSLAKREIVGGRSWFSEGSRFFLGLQREDGAIPDPTCMSPKDVLGTATALLFLTRATKPVSGG
ncbi:MAG: hypothetical protein V3T86_03315 [Planctomycetota bacterium]